MQCLFIKLLHKIYNIKIACPWCRASFLWMSQKQINLSGFSEFECYAAYVLKYYPQKYCLRLWKNLRNARTYVGSDKTKCSLSWFRSLFDVVSYEDFDSQWFLCKLLCVIDPKHRIPFTYIYRLINPLYRKYLKARLFIRKVLINK